MSKRSRRRKRQARKREALRKGRQQRSPGPPLAPSAAAPPVPPEEPEPEPFRPLHSVASARRYAEEHLGIEQVVLADATGGLRQRRAYLEIVNNVLAPLQALHAEGHEMPPALAIDPVLFLGTEGMYGRLNPDHDPSPRIEMNPDLDLWDAPVLATVLATGLFSTDHPHGSLYHEYLHFRLHRANLWLYQVYSAGSLLQNDVRELGVRVSQDAQDNPLEFASEVYAALRTGRRFDEDVMHLYRTILRSVGLEETDV
jgi:hypothetical protein